MRMKSTVTPPITNSTATTSTPALELSLLAGLGPMLGSELGMMLGSALGLLRVGDGLDDGEARSFPGCFFLTPGSLGDGDD
jgi:hypothetical protein